MEDHFREVTKKVSAGKGAQGSIEMISARQGSTAQCRDDQRRAGEPGAVAKMISAGMEVQCAVEDGQRR